MRTLSPSRIADSPDGDFGGEMQRGIGRRPFIQVLGVLSATLALAPQTLLAQSDGEAQEWFDTVNKFMFTVAPRSQAREMSAQLSRARITRVSWKGPFHWGFAAPFIFEGSTIASQRVICENGFQVNQLPYYDSSCPCNDHSDLNAAEIRTVIDPYEMDRFGCVLAPAAQREPLNNDHARYVGRAAANYDHVNLNDWYVPAERRMAGNGQTRTGFHLQHKTETRHGKPRTDFIVSSDI